MRNGNAISLPQGLATPVPVVDLARMQANIESMALEMSARGVRLWPHFKTPRTIEVARRQLDAGAAGVTCATIVEAEALAAGGVNAIFIAYPLWVDAAREQRLRRLAGTVNLRVGVDSAEGAERLAEATHGVEKQPVVMLEIDCGEGRTGVAPEQAGRLAARVASAGLRVEGVFTHGGHGYDPALAGQAADDEVSALATAKRAVEAAGYECAAVSAGSTPTVPRSAVPPVNEERPGTYVFGDRQQLAIGSIQPDRVALFVAATVVSTAVDGQFVIDAGGKALSRDRPAWLEGHGLIPAYPEARVTRVFDHHAVCELPAGTQRPRPGDVVAVIPNHVCPVVNLAAALVVVDDGQVAGRWQVLARGSF